MPLPPSLDLYRSIRRLHRNLQPALRALGNQYLRDEFARHRSADPQYVAGFVHEWTLYRDSLRNSSGIEVGVPEGRTLKTEELDALSDAQIEGGVGGRRALVSNAGDGRRY
ncbi:hypothetical protein BDK51DRAFT_43922 [Blyttiomyces helicus]|uniref:Succinate dehydrogenase assembly factor 3 n=1 Tax=Blyttiomyces helicus TaxID=388810 RepID=A0A4P9W0L3_9FUNG|nr:hypothetical protein BDK51DRAFT_43922 [Blyttiomyces helicus]|eukprot:RKO84865.1 hypothetical protein BDK51DRAFT_43922 [Blyttiomyces helicus]